MTVTESGGEAAAMAFGYVPGRRVLCVRAVAEVSRAEAGVVPRVHLFQPPDLENVGAAVANGNRPGRILDLGHRAAGIAPVVDEWAVGADPGRLAARGIGAALGVAEIVFDQRLRGAGRPQVGPRGVRQSARTAIDGLAL